MCCCKFNPFVKLQRHPTNNHVKDILVCFRPSAATRRCRLANLVRRAIFASLNLKSWSLQANDLCVGSVSSWVVVCCATGCCCGWTCYLSLRALFPRSSMIRAVRSRGTWRNSCASPGDAVLGSLEIQDEIRKGPMRHSVLAATSCGAGSQAHLRYSSTFF